MAKIKMLKINANATLIDLKTSAFAWRAIQ